MKVIAYLHTHWDREWYRTFEEFRIRFVEVFDDIAKKLLAGEFSQFYLDGQVVLIEDLCELYPEKEKLIKDLIRQNKLIIGPWYSLADEFLVTGESLIRNLLFGMKKSESMGCSEFIGYLPDAFGHTGSMPQILNSFGIKNALIWRGAGNRESEFIWSSKDGSSVVATHLIEGYFQDYLSSNNLEGVVGFLDKVQKKNIGDAILLPVGADHLGVADDLSKKIEQLNSTSKYEIEVGSVFDYMKLLPVVEEEVKGELRDNSCNFILPGTYSTRNYLKRQNALLTWQIKVVEAFLSMSKIIENETSKKSEIDYVWKLLLKNHAHDSICGCSVDEVHREMEIRNAKIKQVLDTLIERYLIEAKKTAGQNEVFAFNSSGFFYDGILKFKTTKKLDKKVFQLLRKDFGFPSDILQDIHKVPVAEDMREIYTYACNIKKIEPLYFGTVQPIQNNDLSIKHNSLENEFLKVEVQRDGSLEILDKMTGQSKKGLHVIEDKIDEGDSYNFSPKINSKTKQADFVSCGIVQDGMVQSALELVYQLEEMEIKTRLILDSKSSILQFRTVFENKSENHLLQVKFVMPDNITNINSEDALGLIEREFDYNYDLIKQKSAEGFEELKTNTAPMQRFVWAQKMGLLSKGLHEYEVFQNELKLTLLRSVGLLSKTKMHTRSIYAGPPLETPEMQCKREFCCEYAICFCNEPNEMFQVADKYYNPMVAGLSLGEKIKEFNNSICLNNPNIYLMAVKEAEDKQGLILRLLNITDNEQKLTINAQETNSLEELKKSSLSELSFDPFELKTLRLLQNFL